MKDVVWQGKKKTKNTLIRYTYLVIVDNLVLLNHGLQRNSFLTFNAIMFGGLSGGIRWVFLWTSQKALKSVFFPAFDLHGLLGELLDKEFCVLFDKPGTNEYAMKSFVVFIFHVNAHSDPH